MEISGKIESVDLIKYLAYGDLATHWRRTSNFDHYADEDGLRMSKQKSGTSGSSFSRRFPAFFK
jgi:hypothetical protein